MLWHSHPACVFQHFWFQHHSIPCHEPHCILGRSLSGSGAPDGDVKTVDNDTLLCPWSQQVEEVHLDILNSKLQLKINSTHILSFENRKPLLLTIYCHYLKDFEVSLWYQNKRLISEIYWISWGLLMTPVIVLQLPPTVWYNICTVL